LYVKCRFWRLMGLDPFPGGMGFKNYQPELESTET